jgi:hypothetical protein
MVLISEDKAKRLRRRLRRRRLRRRRLRRMRLQRRRQRALFTAIS